MDVFVGGQVWIPKSPDVEDLIESLRGSLTVERRVVGDFADDAGPSIVCLYSETDDQFGIPRNYFFSEVSSPHNYQWGVSVGHPIRVTNTLRHEGAYAEQGEAIEAFAGMFASARDGLSVCAAGGPVAAAGVRWMRSAGGILQARTAWGKTAWALGLVARVGVTTLVVVHKEFLMRQWLSRIRKFLPDARVGVIQEGTCDFEGRDIVVAMVHSLALDDMRGVRYPKEMYDYFGMVVTDECHRVAANTWAVVPARFPALYRVGISATPRRKDGTERVFHDHIGHVKFVAQSPAVDAVVRVKQFIAPFGEKVSSGELKSSVVLSVLATDSRRNRFIAKSILDALLHPQRRKVLVLSHRLEQLEELVSLVMSRSDCPSDLTVGYYTGSWYTGGRREALRRGLWEMDAEGRAEAVLAIYRSLSRRKEYPGGMIVDGVCGGVGDVAVAGCPGGKTHVVWVDRGEMVGSEGRFIALEMLTDDELFTLARLFGVRQDRKRSTKPQSEEDLYQAEGARLIMATYQLAEEGVDLPPVDTLVLASPHGDVEQSIGRGRRRCVPVALGGVLEPADCRHYCPWRADGCLGKAPLAVLDVVDVGVALSERRFKSRSRYYRAEQFRVV